MATFKACVRKQRADGIWPVYIRVTHNRKIGYIKTDKMVNNKGIAGGEIVDPYVIRYCVDHIIEYTERLNKVDTAHWTVQEVMEYLNNIDEDISFSDYARKHRDKMINSGQERNAKNYRLAFQSLEEYAGSSDVKFSHLTSSFLNAWIGSLAKTKRAKEMYPICIRQIYKSAVREFNDSERGIVRIKFDPWPKVDIPRADTPEKKAITPEECRAFFSAPIPESKFKSPVPELGRDVAMMILCLGGINTIDLYELKKSDYRNGVIGYERAKTRKARMDNAYIEMRVPPIVQPLFEKYASREDDEYLLNFHARYSNADSLNANANIGIKKICESMGIKKEDYYCCYTFRHTWATVAQNDCGASIAEVGFGMNHSMHNVTRGYMQIDFSPAWKLNEKVVDFIFFSDKASSRNKAKEETFERISKYNMVRGELWHQGKMLSFVEDSGYTSIDGVIDSIEIPDDILAGTTLLYKIINLDKEQTAIHYRKRH
jgi:integrase